MSPSSSRRRGHSPGVFNVSFTTSWETVSTSSHSSSYLLSVSNSSSMASGESASSGYISDGNNDGPSPSPNFDNLIEGYQLMDHGDVCLRCRMPLMIESSSDNNNHNSTGVCIACEEEFERKLVDFAAIHAKKTYDEDDEDDDDDESNDNRYDDEFIDDDEEEEDDASSSCSISYSKHGRRTTTVFKSVKFGNLPRRGREEDDLKVVVMDDSNVLSYRIHGASMNIEVSLAPPISIDTINDGWQGNSEDVSTDSPTLEISVLSEEEITPYCSREEDGELQPNMTEEAEFRREDNNTSSSRNVKQSNDVGVQTLEAIRKMSDDGSANLIPPPLLKKTIAALHAAKEAVVLSKAAAWPKVCLGNSSPKHHEEKVVGTPQMSNKTVLAAAGTYVADVSTFNESHNHSSGVVVEDQVVNEYEEENVIYMKPQSCHSEHESRTNVVLQNKSINEERNPINERDDESQHGSRIESVQSDSVDCKQDAVGVSNESNSCEAVEDGNDSLAAMITLDELCMSKQELIKGSSLENAAENFASLIRHSSNIKANLPPSVARSVIVKRLITKFWKENSEVKHNQQSRFHKECIDEDNNIDEQKSQMDPTAQSISKDQGNNCDESLSALSDDRHRIDNTTLNDKATSQQLDPLAETSSDSDRHTTSGIDPLYETGEMRTPKYCLASSVTDPPDETCSLPVIDPPDVSRPDETSTLPVVDPPDESSMTNLIFLSSDKDPPEESEPIIRLTASTETVSNTYMGFVEKYCTPAKESSGYSEESFYSKWRKIRYDAMATVELHARQESNNRNETPNVNDVVNDVDIRCQLSQLEFKFSQLSIPKNNVTSSVIPISSFSNSVCDKPMDPPSSVGTSDSMFAGALDKMNTLDNYLRLIDVDVSHNRQQQHLPLSPTAAARRQRYKEKLIEEEMTRLNRVVFQ